MNFETMDWDAEAKRVTQAFGVEGECEFVTTEFSDERRLIHKISGSSIKIATRLYLQVSYSDYARRFVLWEGWDGRQGWQSEINVKWNGRALIPINEQRNRVRMARAMFHLDMLNEEVEAAIDASITTHQKLEWALEYEERYWSFK